MLVCIGSDNCTALENSNREIPEHLKELHQDYLHKLDEGEIEKKRANIGYIGKGYKFDIDEEN